MSRVPLNIVVAVAAVLALAAGGAWLVDHARQPRGSLAHARHRPPPAEAAVPAGARLVTLEVSGMMCTNCASRVTIALETTSGVRSCDVDPSASRAWVVCDRGVADTSLVAAVVGAGTGSEYAAKVVHR
jgi:copper chaperone CopZ